MSISILGLIDRNPANIYQHKLISLISKQSYWHMSAASQGV